LAHFADRATSSPAREQTGRLALIAEQRLAGKGTATLRSKARTVPGDGALA